MASAPNQKWIADFTYIGTASGLALCGGSRRPPLLAGGGWSMSSSMAAQLVTDALIMAIWRRFKPKYPRGVYRTGGRGSDFRDFSGIARNRIGNG